MGVPSEVLPFKTASVSVSLSSKAEVVIWATTSERASPLTSPNDSEFAFQGKIYYVCLLNGPGVSLWKLRTPSTESRFVLRKKDGDTLLKISLI